MDFPILKSFDLGASMDGVSVIIIHDLCGNSKSVEDLKEALEWAVEHLHKGCRPNA